MKKMRCIPLPEITREDVAFARELTLKALSGIGQADPNQPLHCRKAPYNGEE